VLPGVCGLVGLFEQVGMLEGSKRTARRRGHLFLGRRFRLLPWWRRG
jgi:hypothetical protein